MAAPRTALRRRKRTAVCVNLFDQIVSKSTKLLREDCISDRNALKLLDFVDAVQNKCSVAVEKLVFRVRILKSEVCRLEQLQSQTQEMLALEGERRRQAEHTRDQLVRKVEIIRDIIQSNDFDEAKRRLDLIDRSVAECNKSFHDAMLEHSAGSLLDPANVSDGSFSYKVRLSSCSRRPSSAGKALDYTRGILRRSARISKARSSSVPKIMDINSTTVNDKQDFRPAVPHTAGQKRVSDGSREEYSQVDAKRGLLSRQYQPFTPAAHSPNSDTTESDGPEVLARQQNTNNPATPLTATFSRLNRPHNFSSRPVLRLETCAYCGTRIIFGKSALKCATCRIVVHPSCRPHLIQTCIPSSVSRTPLSSLKKRTSAGSPKSVTSHTTAKLFVHPTTLPPSPTLSHRRLNSTRSIELAALCPEDQFPRIPALVIHCVTEVTARGMQTVGLYRVSGSERLVRDLYEKFFTSKTTPVLARIEDIHVVCGCLKHFLRNLSEPLVTFAYRPILASASAGAQSGDENALNYAVDVLYALPAPNRDTLSYLMLHLKTVAGSPACQMGEENLAKIFGPTLVGYSCPDPQLMQTVTEIATQQAVLRLLFCIPNDVYSAILSTPSVTEKLDLSAHPDTYFSPVFTRPEDLLSHTPMSLRKTPHKTMVASARKRFFPHFASRRDLTNTS